MISCQSSRFIRHVRKFAYALPRGNQIESEINDPIRLSDFYGLESLYIGRIYLYGRGNGYESRTSEECNNEGGGSGRGVGVEEGKREG